MAEKLDFVLEASRCLHCKNQPCVVACPAHNPIPEFMEKIKISDFVGARTLWHTTSNLPEICGVLCPQELLCEGHCTLNKIHKPIRIGWLEKSVASMFVDTVDYPTEKNGKKHLVIGLGPAGLANALKMAEYGYDVTAIEAQDSLGGAIYGSIPDFRFPASDLEVFQMRLDQLSVQTHYRKVVGKDVFLDDLLPDYDSVFIAMGLDLPVPIEIEHEDLKIYYAIDLLQKKRYSLAVLDKMTGKKVGIIGLGNVAIDISRVLLKLNKEVHIIYRRTLDEAPASRKEIMEAVEEGAVIHELFGPTRFRRLESQKVLDCDKTCLIKDPESQRSKVEVIPGIQEQFVLDDIIFATGQMPSDLALKGSQIRLQAESGSFLTTHPKVFVGGDRVTKNKRIVDAMVSGIEVAKWIHSQH